ncbi:putative vacuolar protein sorting-associated protein TDA6 [Pseudocercospora fuligena]|uniref:Putative vacuolar protein sorting-associated protein TDA6 n=1 Tax=Pseudocercospora fuligena TaxID=685502 RepID=A0A8H6RS21_9PEZI|nr:putative vacuolar protein sorting-associated protein TDA6 [Pseudocercospora fuligena]
MLAALVLTAGLTVNAVPLERRQAAPTGVPDYVTKYAPVVHLFSAEPYFPSDIGAQLANTKAYINLTAANGGPSTLTLDNLNDLNNLANSSDGKDIYLTSISDPTTNPRPQYLYGVKPDSNGKTNNAISSAIITVDKGNNTLDAFYFYFYAFDYGGDYIAVGNIGNHVGDWEHNMIRFENGTPTQIYYSQHSGGQAFSYSATEKFENTGRAITYSANGTHANYATPGTHDHTIPGVNLPAGPVEDHSDAGPVWDPTLSAYFYSYTPANDSFRAYGDAAPVNWLLFNGQWGDDKYPESDPRQECFLGIDGLCKYSSGPNGPKFKDLDRENVCPDGKECVVSPILLPREDDGGLME